MANEIRTTAKLRYTIGSVDVRLESVGLNVTVTGPGNSPYPYVHQLQTVGTSIEDLDFGDGAADGFLLLINRDATNFVTLSVSLGLVNIGFAKVQPGEHVLFRTLGTIKAQADDANCIVEYLYVTGAAPV